MKTCGYLRIGKAVKTATLSCIRSGAAEGYTTLWVKGALLRVPANQLPEALLNIAHIFCLQDYGLHPDFTPKPGWTVIDIGAYIGFYTVWAGLRTGRGLVIAVEPNPLARSILYENIVLNRLEDRVRVDPRAVGTSNTVVKLYVPPYWANASLLKSYAEEYGEHLLEVPVRTTTLKNLLETHKLSSIDLAKIDVEGYEAAIVEAIVSAEPRPQRIVVEVHEPTVNVRYIVKVLRSGGYKVPLTLAFEKGQYIVYARTKELRAS